MSGIFRKKDKEGTGYSYNYTNHNAPKETKSKTIVSFEYSFSTTDFYNNLGKQLPYENCSFTLLREGDKARCKAFGYGNYGTKFNIEFTTDLGVLGELQLLIDRLNLGKYNGISKGVQGVHPQCATRLSVKYDSGERILASDNAGPILLTQESFELYEFFQALAKKDNPMHMYSDEEFRQIMSDLNGTFKTADNSKTIILKSHYIDIFEGDNLTDHSYFYIIANVLYSSYSEDKTFTLYTHILWKDSKLIAFGKDGSQIEFLPI